MVAHHGSEAQMVDLGIRHFAEFLSITPGSQHHGRIFCQLFQDGQYQGRIGVNRYQGYESPELRVEWLSPG